MPFGHSPILLVTSHKCANLSCQVRTHVPVSCEWGGDPPLPPVWVGVYVGGCVYVCMSYVLPMSCACVGGLVCVLCVCLSVRLLCVCWCGSGVSCVICVLVCHSPYIRAVLVFAYGLLMSDVFPHAFALVCMYRYDIHTCLPPCIRGRVLCCVWVWKCILIKFLTSVPTCLVRL